MILISFIAQPPKKHSSGRVASVPLCAYAPLSAGISILIFFCYAPNINTSIAKGVQLTSICNNATFVAY